MSVAPQCFGRWQASGPRCRIQTGNRADATRVLNQSKQVAKAVQQTDDFHVIARTEALISGRAALLS